VYPEGWLDASHLTLCFALTVLKTSERPAARFPSLPAVLRSTWSNSNVSVKRRTTGGAMRGGPAPHPGAGVPGLLGGAEGLRDEGASAGNASASSVSRAALVPAGEGPRVLALRELGTSAFSADSDGNGSGAPSSSRRRYSYRSATRRHYPKFRDMPLTWSSAAVSAAIWEVYVS